MEELKIYGVRCLGCFHHCTRHKASSDAFEGGALVRAGVQQMDRLAFSYGAKMTTHTLDGTCVCVNSVFACLMSILTFVFYVPVT